MSNDINKSSTSDFQGKRDSAFQMNNTTSKPRSDEVVKLRKKFQLLSVVPAANPNIQSELEKERAALLPFVKEVVILDSSELHKVIHFRKMYKSLYTQSEELQYNVPFQPFFHTFTKVQIISSTQNVVKEHVSAIVCHGHWNGGQWRLLGVRYQNGQFVPLMDVIDFIESKGKDVQLLAVCKEGSEENLEFMPDKKLIQINSDKVSIGYVEDEDFISVAAINAKAHFLNIETTSAIH